MRSQAETDLTKGDKQPATRSSAATLTKVGEGKERCCFGGISAKQIPGCPTPFVLNLHPPAFPVPSLSHPSKNSSRARVGKMTLACTIAQRV